MGLITSREQTMLDGPVPPTKSNHVRQPSTRNRTKPPMPDRDELESRFIKVLDVVDSKEKADLEGMEYIYKRFTREVIKVKEQAILILSIMFESGLQFILLFADPCYTFYKWAL
ncbi:hypothetical protein ACJJTC_008212 [Scirpophaga incertulas]